MLDNAPDVAADILEAEHQLGIREGNGRHVLKRMKPIHRTISELFCLGLSNVEIAQVVERTPHYIGVVLSHEIVKDDVSNRIEASRAQLRSVQTQAVARVCDSLQEAAGLRMNMQGIDRYIKLSEHLGIQDEAKETAEDVVGRILSQQVNVQVNVGTAEGKAVTVSTERIECDLGDE